MSIKNWSVVFMRSAASEWMKMLQIGENILFYYYYLQTQTNYNANSVSRSDYFFQGNEINILNILEWFLVCMQFVM